MSRLLTLLLPRPSNLRRNRARQWERAAAVARMSLFERLDYNLAAGYLAVGW